jgi:tryptophan-rich sensory protein
MERPGIGSYAVLAGFVAACLGTGLLGGLATASSVSDWYPGLAKPLWNPPAWVFGPVWTALYLMMAVAGWLVWRKDIRFSAVRLALILFAVQLVLNLLWTIVFFGLRAPGLAVLEIAVFWAALVMTVLAFFGQSRLAGFLMVPYLAWVTFAGVLNVAIWRLN